MILEDVDDNHCWMVVMVEVVVVQVHPQRVANDVVYHNKSNNDHHYYQDWWWWWLVGDVAVSSFLHAIVVVAVVAFESRAVGYVVVLVVEHDYILHDDFGTTPKGGERERRG